MLGRKIQTLLEVSREANVPYYLAQLYWYSCQFSWRVRHHHLLKHWTQCTSRSLKWKWGPLSRRGWELWLSLGSPQGIQTSLHLVRWKMSLHLRHCRESRPSLSQGILGSIILEAENTESLSHTYFWGNAPLEVHLESWLTSSVEDRESFSTPDDMGCTEVSSSCSK